jgi:4a-hydroxytetrahydrobiopterin dehydratase
MGSGAAVPWLHATKETEMADEVLDGDALAGAVADLEGWEVDDGTLHKVFEFDDFVAAFGFMARVALVAEKADHHPDWSNSWNKVDVHLVNHAAGGITAKDVELASRMDELA